MAENIWHYVADKDRQESASLAQLRVLLASRTLSLDTPVWSNGMSEWKPAGSLVELQADCASVENATAIPALSTSPLGYFNAVGGLPPRAAQALAGHATPRGETGDWPLNDSHFAQLQNAIKIRKKISVAVGLYRLLFVLSILSSLGLGISAIGELASGRHAQIAMGTGLSIAAGITVGFTVLYWLVWRATVRSRRWASLTMLIVFTLLIAVEIFSIVAISNTARSSGPEIIGPIVFLLFCLGFAAVSANAFIAIPKYLSQPAWCQELLAVMKQ